MLIYRKPVTLRSGVSPDFSNHGVDATFAYLKLRRQIERAFTFLSTFVNRVSIGFRQLKVPCARARVSRCSAFLVAVANVVSFSPKKQVIGVNARRIVAAGTVVQNTKAVGNVAVMNEPREPVGGR